MVITTSPGCVGQGFSGPEDPGTDWKEGDPEGATKGLWRGRLRNPTLQHVVIGVIGWMV